MKRCLVFVGGTVSDYGFIREMLSPEDILIAADSGARHLAVLGLMPDLVVGDMDSLDPEILARVRCSGVRCAVHKAEKDETDGELAVEAAIALGAQEIRILGIMGNRLDHFLGVLSLMKRCLDLKIPCSMVSEEQEIWLLEGTNQLSFPAGTLISFLPFGDEAQGVTLTGFKYPLQDYHYRHGKPIGLSNVIKDTPATVHVGQGVLVAVRTR